MTTRHHFSQIRRNSKIKRTRFILKAKYLLLLKASKKQSKKWKKKTQLIFLSRLGSFSSFCPSLCLAAFFSPLVNVNESLKVSTFSSTCSYPTKSLFLHPQFLLISVMPVIKVFSTIGSYHLLLVTND